MIWIDHLKKSKFRKSWSIFNIFLLMLADWLHEHSQPLSNIIVFSNKNFTNAPQGSVFRKGDALDGHLLLLVNSGRFPRSGDHIPADHISHGLLNHSYEIRSPNILGITIQDLVCRVALCYVLRGCHSLISESAECSAKCFHATVLSTRAVISKDSVFIAFPSR